MRILRNQPSRRQVIAATFVVVLFFVVAALWSARLTWNERNAEVEEQAGSIAATGAAYLGQYLSGLDSLASALSRHPAVVGLDGARSGPLFADLLRDQPLLLNIVLRDREGVRRASALPATVNTDPPNTPPYVSKVIASGRPVVGEMMPGPITGKPTVALAYPVRGAGDALVGVLVLGLNLGQLQSLFSAIPLPEGSVVTLTDEKSRVLARSRGTRTP